MKKIFTAITALLCAITMSAEEYFLSTTEDDGDKFFQEGPVIVTCEEVTDVGIILEDYKKADVSNEGSSVIKKIKLIPAPSIDIFSFEIPKVTNMNYMFNGCTNLKRIFASDNWNANDVENNTGMFGGCTNLTNYDASVVDKTHARLGSSGYLSKIKVIMIEAPDSWKNQSNPVVEDLEDGNENCD
ncbi:MAG: DUF285 domain-containing protein [Paludibacteraceae bacterium]|nr:DUF285 domain-containing protein [Paludibacteraceae bacterium]